MCVCYSKSLTAPINSQPISSLTDLANDKCSGFMALCLHIGLSRITSESTGQ